MDSLFTVPMPLTFWALLLTRLQADVQVQQAAVLAAAAPLSFTVSTEKDDNARLERTQTHMQIAIDRLDAMSLLALTVRTQLESCRFEIGAAALHARIEFVAQHSAFYETFLKDRSSRVNASQAVATMLAAYASASKPQGGEWAATERGRLLAQTIQVPVLSAEETAPFDKAARYLRNDLGTLKSQLDSLLATTKLSLSVAPELADELSEQGIGVEPAVAESEESAEAGAPPADAPAVDGN